MLEAYYSHSKIVFNFQHFPSITYNTTFALSKTWFSKIWLDKNNTINYKRKFRVIKCYFMKILLENSMRQLCKGKIEQLLPRFQLVKIFVLSYPDLVRQRRQCNHFSKKLV